MPHRSNKAKIAASAAMLAASCALLAGLTFAWFTDTVASGSSTITAGELRLVLQQDPADDGGAQSWRDVTEAEPVFRDVAFEPGKSAAVNLRAVNAGTLAATYELRFANVRASANLDQALEVYLDGARLGTLAELAGSGTPLAAGSVLPGNATARPIGCLELAMPAGHGNDYQGARVTFDLQLVATQAPAEQDGFGSSAYDEHAGLPGIDAPGANG